MVLSRKPVKRCGADANEKGAEHARAHYPNVRVELDYSQTPLLRAFSESSQSPFSHAVLKSAHILSGWLIFR